MKWIRRLLYPHPALAILLSLLSAVGLGWVFLTGREMTSWGYAMYPVSAYALTVACLWGIPLVIRWAKQLRTGKTLEQKNRKFHKSLLLGLAVNLVYALFHMLIGAIGRSVWTGSQGAYQLVMALIHLVLLTYEKKMAGRGDAEKQRIGWEGFRACGVWLLVLHLTMAGLVVQMVWRGETENSHPILVIGVAAYTFYKLTMALIRVAQYRKNASPLWGAARNIDLSEAMMNLFTLQASLLGVFGTAEQGDFRFFMNALSGAAVCLLTVGGAIGMILHGEKRRAAWEEHDG